MDALHFDYNQVKGTFDLNVLSQEFTASHRTNRILGFSHQERVTYNDFISSLHHEDKKVWEQSISNNFPNKYMKIEARLATDKCFKWLKIQGRILYDEQHQPIHIRGSIQDITELKELFNEIKNSEHKFHLLADVMPLKVWTSDAFGNFDFFNQATYDYTGLDMQQLKSGGWSGLLHPEDVETTMSIWKKAISEGIEFVTEHRLVNIHGEYRWHQSRAIPQKDSMGKIQMWLGNTTDIHGQKNFVTELERKIKRRTRTLIEENVNLAKTNNELQQFAYIASHDLQEPLRKIITFSNRIQQQYREDLPEGSKTYLEKIISSSQRMTRLIEDLLNFSMIAGSDEQFSQTDLNEVLELILADFEESALSKHATITHDKLPVIQAIPVQMSQLFQNLIGNALKFSRETTKPVISIEAFPLQAEEIATHSELQAGKQYIELRVKDNGIGFDQEYADKIFHIFQRLNHEQKYKGSGIGLALCKKIAENHHGKIWVNSHKGEGSEFHIILPVALNGSTSFN